MQARKIIIASVIILSAILCGCSEIKTENNPVSSVASNDLFILTISAGSSQYSSDSVIICSADLKYTGSEPITIYHSQPLLAFGIKDDKYFDNGYIRLDELISTTFNPGDEITYEFKKSGGWSQDEPNAAFYGEFYAQKELILPKGEYQLSANLEYSLDQNNMTATKQQLSSAVSIKVR